MKYKVCPFCGAHLDHGEQCDCQKNQNKGEKKESAPDAAGAPSNEDISASVSVSEPMPDVNRCLGLRRICQETGAMGKDIALVVRETFPKFNRQLLAQCMAPEKYGIVIHPEGLAVICNTYALRLEAPAQEEEMPKPAKKEPKRKLPRKLTFRMTHRDYARLLCKIEADGYDSVQAWLYDNLLRLMGGSENANA